jgi:hypothetical protein
MLSEISFESKVLESTIETNDSNNLKALLLISRKKRKKKHRMKSVLQNYVRIKLNEI